MIHFKCKYVNKDKLIMFTKDEPGYCEFQGLTEKEIKDYEIQGIEVIDRPTEDLISVPIVLTESWLNNCNLTIH